MTKYTAGDVLLAELPFTSGESRKIRPVVVILDTGDEDVTVAPITTSIAAAAESIPLKEYREAGLLKPSAIRLHKIATIHKTRTRARLGSCPLATSLRSPNRGGSSFRPGNRKNKASTS